MSRFRKTLLVPAKYEIGLLRKVFKSSSQADIPPTKYKPKIEAPMEILDEFPYFLDRVDIAPLKLNCNGGIFF
jgi:hypothetical protein